MNKITQKWIAIFLVVVSIVLFSHTITNAQTSTTTMMCSDRSLVNPQLFIFIFVVSLYLFLRFFRDSIRDDSWLPSFSYNPDNEVKTNSLSSFRKLFVGKKYNYKPPFSLGRTQMAWWFFIIVGSFLFIFVSNCNLTEIINEQALILIGISASTGISSVFIDDGKKHLSVEEIERISSLKRKLDNSQLEARQRIKIENEIKSIIPCSSGWLKDITTTRDGVNFYRFQIFVWTLILGIIFLFIVWEHLHFPEFDSHLLTLQGISAGTYLGFKFPEKSKSSNNELLKKPEPIGELPKLTETSNNNAEHNTSKSPSVPSNPQKTF